MQRLLVEARMDEVDSGHAKLLLAVLRRLARDPSVLTLSADDKEMQAKTLAGHKRNGVTCQGCTACKNPNWVIKTANVVNLWSMCCKLFIAVHLASAQLSFACRFEAFVFSLLCVACNGLGVWPCS